MQFLALINTSDTNLQHKETDSLQKDENQVEMIYRNNKAS